MNCYRRTIAQLLGVVRYILEALQTNVPMTKRSKPLNLLGCGVLTYCRDIYYRDVALFQKQSNIDNVSNSSTSTD
jgi:hypothetical protein